MRRGCGRVTTRRRYRMTAVCSKTARRPRAPAPRLCMSGMREVRFGPRGLRFSQVHQPNHRMKEELPRSVQCCHVRQVYGPAQDGLQNRDHPGVLGPANCLGYDRERVVNCPCIRMVKCVPEDTGSDPERVTENRYIPSGSHRVFSYTSPRDGSRIKPLLKIVHPTFWIGCVRSYNDGRVRERMAGRLHDPQMRVRQASRPEENTYLLREMLRVHISGNRLIPVGTKLPRHRDILLDITSVLSISYGVGAPSSRVLLIWTAYMLRCMQPTLNKWLAHLRLIDNRLLSKLAYQEISRDLPVEEVGDV
jgi:hypothetical protein